MKESVPKEQARNDPEPNKLLMGIPIYKERVLAE